MWELIVRFPRNQALMIDFPVVHSVNQHLSVYGSTALVDRGRFFTFLILYTVGRLLVLGSVRIKAPT
jgi:hypothetical protein